MSIVGLVVFILTMLSAAILFGVLPKPDGSDGYLCAWTLNRIDALTRWLDKRRTP